MFPAAEANHHFDESDSWFLAGKLIRQITSKNYQFVTICDRNKIVTLTFNFNQLSVFVLDTGDYSTFTEHDVPLVNTADTKLNYSNVKLDLSIQIIIGNGYMA
jgi:outer membrane lipoprotein-sorting protein